GLLRGSVVGHAVAVVPAVSAGVLKGVADNLLGARAADELEPLGHVGRLLVLDAGVGVLFVFPDDDQVHVGVLGRDEGVVGHARPHVGVQAQHLAGGHVEALVAAALGRG